MNSKFLALVLLSSLAACGPNGSSDKKKDKPVDSQEVVSLNGRWKATKLTCRAANRLPVDIQVELSSGALAIIGVKEETEDYTCHLALAFLRNPGTLFSDNTIQKEAGYLMNGHTREVCRFNDPNTPGSDSTSTRPAETVSYNIQLDRVARKISLQIDGLFECSDLSLTLVQK